MTRIKEFNLPDLGEGLTEGEILKWLVQVGDEIELNQPIVEVETAKAAVEIPAKWAGKVVEIHHPEGTTVEVGMPIIAIDTDPSAGPLPGTTSAPSADLPEPSAASLAAVEVAPAEGMVEPGLIGGAAPGGRTAVLVGYGPRTGAAKRRPRKDAGGTPPRACRCLRRARCSGRSGCFARRLLRRRSWRRRWPSSRSRSRSRSPVSGRWPSRRSASWPATSASTSTG